MKKASSRDQSCIHFLQWALPRLDLRWPGFRKVRRQVCRRVWKRMGRLGLADFETYRDYLEQNAEEWVILDSFCRIPISRFYRDRGVFDHLRAVILPELARRAAAELRPLRLWSAGCAAGEEPYTLALVVALDLKADFPDLPVIICATDIDEATIQRAARGFFSRSSLEDLPGEWIRKAFMKRKDGHFLRPAFRRLVTFCQQDIRRHMPMGTFDLVLCRNLVATYFGEELQREVLSNIRKRMIPGGYLVLGCHEQLPTGGLGFVAVDNHFPIWQKATDEILEGSDQVKGR